MAHAQFSPSSAHRWLKCPGSVVLESTCPDTSSEFADEGTAAHFLAATALTEGKQTDAYLGRSIILHAKGECFDAVPEDTTDVRGSFTVDAEMADQVQKYVDLIRAIDGQLLVEQRLPICQITDEDDAHGTSDSVIFAGHELVIADLKYGRGVKVDAKDNDQLKIYALAALDEYEFLGDFTQCRLIIIQPRLDHVSEWVISVEELQAFRRVVRDAVEAAQKCKPTSLYLQPGEKQCRFCKAKASCPGLTQQLLNTIADDFVDLEKPLAPQLEKAEERISNCDTPHLSECMSVVDMVESWCKAVRARVESELLGGNAVPGYKLVEGRRGPRQWVNPTEAEEMLKTMKLKIEQMYDMKLISPTTAEKLAKAGDIGPRQWPKLQQCITQAEGKPSVAPESDKRPAIQIGASADDFDDILDLVTQAA